MAAPTWVDRPIRLASKNSARMNVERAVRTTTTWQAISGSPVSQCTPAVANSSPG